MKNPVLPLLLLAGALAVTSCTSVNSASGSNASDSLVGAWRGHVQFQTGSFATVKDLELMYLFNAGGTMSESSNYDSAPPVPPAYGVWRKTGPRQYEARYEYYWTKSPAKFEEIAKGGGWGPGGTGLLVQKITLSADGNSFESTLTYDTFDLQGRPADPQCTAVAQGTRLKF